MQTLSRRQHSVRLSHRGNFRWVSLAIALAMMASLAGCGNPAVNSMKQMRTLLQGIWQYTDANDGKYPDSLDQIKEYVGGEAEFKNLMKNPITGDDPGYEYVKFEKTAEGGLEIEHISLYQLRDGQRDLSLSVGFADGSVRPMPKRDESIPLP